LCLFCSLICLCTFDGWVFSLDFYLQDFSIFIFLLPIFSIFFFIDKKINEKKLKHQELSDL